MKNHIYRAGLFLLTFIGLAQNSFGQRYSATGARATAMASTSVLLNDAYGLFNNPGSTETKTLAFLASFNTNYLSLGIHDAQFGLVIPNRKTVWGAGVNYYGDKLFNQLTISGLIGHQVGFGRIGLRLNYHQYYLENYGYKRTASLDLGGRFELSEQVSIGMLIANLSRAKLDRDSSESLGSLLKVGLSYQPIKKIRLDLEVKKNINLPISSSLGIEYQIGEYVLARTGFDFTNAIAALGLGLNLKQFQLDLAGQYQPDLGISGTLSLLISKKHDE